MKLPKIIRILLSVMLPALTAMACTRADVPDNGSDFTGDQLLLTFSMNSASDSSTRTDDIHDETDSEYPEFENGIDLSDLAIFLFARSDSEDSEERLLLKASDMTAARNGRLSVTGASGHYTVRIAINKSLLESLPGMDLDQTGNTKISFRILMLTNSRIASSTLIPEWSELNSDSYSAMIDMISDLSVQMNEIYTDSYSGEDVRGLYAGAGRYCPMFGTAVFTESLAVLANSRPEEACFLGEIMMLRSLAKVRVIDNIRDKDESYYPMITGVEIVSSREASLVLPYNASGYINGYQVHTPNIAPIAPDVESLPDYSYRLGLLDSSIPTGATGTLRIGYLPEQMIGAGESAAEALPMFRITVTNRNEAGEEEQEIYYVPMTAYNGVSFGFGDNILRNHIYTLSITGISNKGMTVKARIVPWGYNRNHIEI